jgi:hypothetical protein
MRVLFKSPKVPVTLKDPRDGRIQPGQLHFELVLVEDGEDPTPAELTNSSRPAGVPAPRVSTHSLRELRTKAAGGPIVIQPPATTTGAGPITIPELVVAQFPDSAAFVLQWQLTPRSEP